MKERAGLVVTTIRTPHCLGTFVDNFKKYGHLDDNVTIWVIPDEKTPREAYTYCGVLDMTGVDVSCPSLEMQEKFLKSIGVDPLFIPRNSDVRRNVGYLMAYAAGVDFVISIDDDNYCPANADFYEEHRSGLFDGQKLLGSEICSVGQYEQVIDGWHNPLSQMGLSVYQRGFPYFERLRQKARPRDSRVYLSEGVMENHANEGLWLGHPDLDGMTWLHHDVTSSQLSNNYLLNPLLTWAPVNSQNTAVRACAIPAYYFIPLDFPAGKGWTGFGDIFQGYFLQACMKQMGGALRIGTPLTDHRRNSHDYLKDAEKEWDSIKVLEELLPALREFALQGTSYADLYVSLSEQLLRWSGNQENLRSQKGWRSAFVDICYFMQVWAKACKTISVGGKIAV